MKPIRTGLIGYGAAGATFHAPLIAVEPRLQLTRIASSRRDAIAHALPEVQIDASFDAMMEGAEIWSLSLRQTKRTTRSRSPRCGPASMW